MTFHSGEIAVQTQAGVREEAQKLCHLISSIIKPAAVEFLGKQQLAAAASVDTHSQVWASLVTGNPGFLQVLNEQIVQIDATPRDGLLSNLHSNPQIGLLVIDLVNRRRLRLNGKVEITPEAKINIKIQQAFFNCPKYIQVRHLHTTVTELQAPPQILTREALNHRDKDWISKADTFFIASSHPETGADASHRGGFPGFVQVVHSNKLMFPDYAGNNMFQTFGNLAVNPNAGLLFVDFEQGHTLQLTGKAKVIWDADKINLFTQAQRLVEFDIQQVVEIQNATTLRWRFGEYSPLIKR